MDALENERCIDKHTRTLCECLQIRFQFIRVYLLFSDFPISVCCVLLNAYVCLCVYVCV